MIAYRITRRPFADLTGAGGRLFEGRCNPKGVATIYCSEHVSLSALEILVHLQQDQVPNDYVLMTIDIPSNVVPLEGLPEQLKEESPLRERHAAWAVTSVIIPQERNVILFPENRDFRASVVRIDAFTFDPRLINRLRVQ